MQKYCGRKFAFQIQCGFQLSRKKKEKKKEGRCWISQVTLSIQPSPSFLQLPSFVSGWWRATQSWQRMLTRRPCRNPPEQRQESMRDRESRPLTPRRKRPKTLQLFWTETVLQWRQTEGSSKSRKYITKTIFGKYNIISHYISPKRLYWMHLKCSQGSPTCCIANSSYFD